MTDMLLRMLGWTTVGLLLALLVRKPVRRAFGAGPAFTLWLLPMVLALAPLLPSQLAPATMLVLPGLTVTPQVAANAGIVAPVDWRFVLFAVWLGGAAVGVARLVWIYVKLRMEMRRDSPACWVAIESALSDLDLRRVRVHAAGPAVLWALPRSLVLLPTDFGQRFDDADTRELVVRHELTHVRRGDAWWSLAMELACAVLWFHPLIWVARPRFRLDQELACDASALRALPSRSAGYAHALLDSVAAQPVPALIPWLAEPQLKERIAMITRIPPGTLRRRAGFLAIAVLLTSGLLVAGGQAAVAVQAATNGTLASVPPSVDIAYKNRNPPKYPVNSLRNSEQGTVMLKVHVDATGNVTKVDIESSRTTTSSAELRASAVTAAEEWKFTPGRKDGKPVGGWITIPVTFSLVPTGTCPDDQAHTAKPPFQCTPLQSTATSS